MTNITQKEFQKWRELDCTKYMLEQLEERYRILQESIPFICEKYAKDKKVNVKSGWMLEFRFFLDNIRGKKTNKRRGLEDA